MCLRSGANRSGEVYNLLMGVKSVNLHGGIIRVAPASKHTSLLHLGVGFSGRHTTLLKPKKVTLRGGTRSQPTPDHIQGNVPNLVLLKRNLDHMQRLDESLLSCFSYRIVFFGSHTI